MSSAEPEDKVEATFALLTAARKLESNSEYWLATEKYVRAHKLLVLLEEEKRKEVEDMTKNNTKADELEGAQQIAKLYKSQAEEYWKQSRKCLLQAMEKELTKTCDEPLDDDQARARNSSFAALFSKPIEAPPKEEPKADDIESRLRALNQSLPSNFKSVQERMSDVNRGLGKLGVSSVYTQPQSSYNHLEDQLEKDEDEQIEEILAQAKDQVLMDKMNQDAPHTTTSQKPVDDNDDSTIGDSDSENSEDDLHLDNDQLGMKVIHKQVTKAQAKLMELLKFVEKAQTKRAKEEEDEIDYNSDDDDEYFPEVQKHDVAFLMMNGKKRLRSAQRNLKKALDEWQDLIL